MRLHSGFILSLLLAACGSSPGSGPGDDPDAGDAAPDAGDATPDAGDATPDGGSNTTPKARVSFVGSMEAAAVPADRRTFQARLDGEPVSPNFDASALSSETGVFHPGAGLGSVELAPGTHTLSLSAGIAVHECLNPPECDQTQDQERGGSASAELVAEAGKSYVVVLQLTSYRGHPEAPVDAIAGIVVYDAGAERTPEGNVFGAFYLRGAEGPGDRNVAVGLASSSCGGEVAVQNVAPGGSLLLDRVPDAEATLVVRPEGGQLVRWALPPVPVDPVTNAPRSPEALPVFGRVWPPLVPSSGSGPGVALTAVSCGG